MFRSTKATAEPRSLFVVEEKNYDLRGQDEMRIASRFRYCAFRDICNACVGTRDASTLRSK